MPNRLVCNITLDYDDPEGWYMPNYNTLTALDDKYKDVKQPNELNTAITYHIGENVLSFDYAGCLYYAKTWPNIYYWVYKDPEPYKKGEIYLCWTTSVYSSQSHYCFSFEQSGKNDYKHRFPDVDYGISLRLFHKL